VSQEALSPLARRSVTIGVVSDGPSPGDTLRDLIEMELRQLLAERGVELTFKSPPEFDAGWQAARMGQALRAALDDPEVDLMLTTGLLTTQAATRATLGKPVVSSILQRLDLFSLADLEGNRSLKENLSFVLLANRVQGDLEAMREMEKPSRVHVAVPEEVVDQLDVLDSEIEALESVMGIDLVILSLSPDLAVSLAAVDSTVEAVLLGPTPRYSSLQRQELVSGLTERRIPTFSFVGHDDLDLGVMASRTPPTETSVSRRAALNLRELIFGAGVGDLPVLITADPELVIEGVTAAAVGYRPSLITLGYATIRNPDALELEETPLELGEAMKLAERRNPDLAISGQEVEISRRERQLTLSPMLPQIGAGIDVSWQDPVGLEGLIPERLLKTGVQAQQMIYDDETISRYRASGRLYEGQQQNYEAARLEVLRDAGVAFLRLQLARALYEIELGNLRLTEENLDLARFRVDVGYSGRDEVFRWEAEVAKRRSDLYSRLAVVEFERVSLNQLLGVDQATRWDTREIPVDSRVFPFLDGRLPDAVTDIDNLEAFREFAVGFALEAAPELLSVGKIREAQEIQLGQRKRAWFLPSFFAGFNWAYHIDRDPSLEGVERSIPQLQIGATYPLFQGAARSFEVSRSTAELNRVTEQERLTRDLIERRTRTAFSSLEASFPSIRFSRTAAENALRNFELVQDKYAQGLVNVTDLLEAQTESFVANQSAAAAVSVFLIDLVNFQRSIAWFEFERTQEEQDALLDRIQNAIEN
jgi:outer membrane protein TolC